MLPDCSREYQLKKFLGEHAPQFAPNPPSKLTAAPLDRQLSVFSAKTQSHAWSIILCPQKVTGPSYNKHCTTHIFQYRISASIYPRQVLFTVYAWYGL